jgi:hypothetical protein
MDLDILDSWNIREIKNLIYVDTHGLEGLANLRNTMSDNGSHSPDRVSVKHRLSWHWVGSDFKFEMSAGGYRENRPQIRTNQVIYPTLYECIVLLPFGKLHLYLAYQRLSQ